MKIPTGNFGYAEPQVQQTRTPMPQGQAAAALGQMGNVITNAGAGMLAEKTAEAERLRREQEAEAKRQQEIAERAKTITAETRAQNALDDLSDQIATGITDGTLSPEDARKRWGDESRKALDTHLADVPPTYKPVLDAQAEGWVGRRGNKLNDAMRVRTQREVGANVMAFTEEMQRAALRDPGAAIEKYSAAMDVMGPQAGYTPEQIHKQKQGFREQVRYTQAYNLVTGASDNRKALESVGKRLGTDEFADMDPQRMAALQSTINSRLMALENRAALQSERWAKEQDRAFSGFAAFMEGGRLPSPEYANDVMSKLKGSPYESAVRSMLEQAPQNVGFAATPVTQQREAINQALGALNTQGSDPEKEKTLRRLQQINTQTEADIAKDPLRAAAERRVIDSVAPLDLSNMQALPQQIAERREQAALVSQWAGRPVSPFTTDEAERMAQQLNTMPTNAKAQMIGNLSKSLGPQQMAALSKQMGGQSPELEVASLLAPLSTTQNRNVADLYLRGKEALKQQRVKSGRDSDDKSGQMLNTRGLIASRLAGAFANPQSMEKAIEAAHGVWAARMAEGEDNIDSVIRLATGGVVERNGQKFILPYGRTEDQIEDTIKRYNPARVGTDRVLIGNMELPAAEFAKKLPSAQIINAPGGYAVRFGNNIARTPSGDLLVIPLE